MITAKMVSELREATGAGMMDCKKALTETNGDMEKAMEYLREKGIAKAAKKSSRIAAEGLISSMTSEDGKTAVIIEVNSETDFVAKNDEFKEFVTNLNKQILAKKPANVEELLGQSYVADENKTVKDVLTEKIANIGENISIRRFEMFETNDGTIATYIHGEGRIGTLVELSAAGHEETAKDVAMHVAAAKPEYLNRESVPADVVGKEIEILKAQALNEGKPEAIVEKMVQGRINKYYQEICLVDQAFVKDPDLSVSKFVASKANGLNVVRYARFEKGEGLEKREENFAEEVMKQINN